MESLKVAFEGSTKWTIPHQLTTVKLRKTTLWLTKDTLIAEASTLVTHARRRTLQQYSTSTVHYTTVPVQLIAWENRPWNDLLCVERVIKHLLTHSRTHCRSMHANVWRVFDFFSKWRLSAILDLLCMFLDHPRRVFGGVYDCADFGWNRCTSFDNMQLFIFYEVDLKMTIHALKMGVGDLSP